MNYLFTAILSFSSLLDFAQPRPVSVQPPRPAAPLFPTVLYPQDFRNPLDIPMSLAANFGELRPNHYHMGLDIRTQHRENLPVFAAADGDVVRVQIEPEGFGQAIYIRHPDGYTTVYGHLNRFFPALAAYVSDQQYRQQSWQVDLAIPPGLFPVKKAALIAYSGSTGGSQGPHLHFEIRRTAGDINLNPLLFGLPVADRTPPVIQRLAWYDRNQGIYDQTPHILPVRHLPGSLLVVPTSRISFAISAFDTQTGSHNPNGIYRAELYEDDRPVIGFEMNNISYDNTRNINAHIDYKTRETGGPFLQQLSFLSGYPFPSIYRVPGTSGGVDPAAGIGSDSAQRSGLAAHAAPLANGVLDLRDGRRHQIRIDVSDTRGNITGLKFNVQFLDQPEASRPEASQHDSDAGQTAKRFYPGMVDGLETSDCAFYLAEKSLYDSATIGATVAGYPGSGLSMPDGVSAVYNIGATWIPLLDPILVRLRPTLAVGSIDKIVMVRFAGRQTEVHRPEWQGGWASAHFREFGNFQLVEDTIAPVITPIGPLEAADLSHAARIAFDVKDNLGPPVKFRAELDGAWLCCTNDKGLAYIYKFDQHCPPGSHTLKVTVEDIAGNRTAMEYHFTR
jgi:murein DD-endopeptidase MepM/ murein hydrolase activator NlpD